jgi:citrate synthase
LWGKLCAAPADLEPELVAVLDDALVLLADHELAASTLAARVAASVRADPYAVVSVGLGAVSGALHGAVSLAVEDLLAEAGRGEAGAPDRATAAATAARIVGARLRRGERLRGFGLALYPDGDPRAAFLLERLRAAGRAAGPAASARLAVVEVVLDTARRLGLPPPNVDFALGALAAISGMIRGAGEAIFAIARTAGWLAHALEEYRQLRPLRPRARYTGPPPAA